MRRWMIGASGLVVYWALWSLATVGWLLAGHATWVVLLILWYTLLLPTALIGLLINRWWAPSLVLALPAVLVAPERCVTIQSGHAIGGTCSGFSDEFSVWLGLAFGALLVGAAAAACLRWAAACLRWATGNPRRRPAEDQPKTA